MSVQTKMTAIADKIRALLGITGAMGLDEMATNLAAEQSNLANAFSAVSSKGGTVSSALISTNLASAIESIPEGVTVQRKAGSFTTNTSGAATVNCGFQPDIVVITSSDLVYSGHEYQLCYAFAEKVTSSPNGIAAYGKTYATVAGTITRTTTGFSISGLTGYSASWSGTAMRNKSFSYMAVKYS